MKIDADGLERMDMKWEIEGKNGTQRGQLFGMHAGEVDQARKAIKQRAKRGDTINIKVI